MYCRRHGNVFRCLCVYVDRADCRLLTGDCPLPSPSRLSSAAGKYNPDRKLEACQVDLGVGEAYLLCLEGIAAAGIAPGEWETRMADEVTISA